jgi:hypothetical protein
MAVLAEEISMSKQHQQLSAEELATYINALEERILRVRTEMQDEISGAEEDRGRDQQLSRWIEMLNGDTL